MKVNSEYATGGRVSQGTVRAVSARTPRPRNRKAQIIVAAGDLFYRFGYHNVGTEDIAEAVGITAGALYRHFRSKQELLAYALLDSLDRVAAVIRRRVPGELSALVAELAETASARRDLGVLWNRELRHLDDEWRLRACERFGEFLAGFVDALRAARAELSSAEAELLARCALSVLTSPSYHRAPIAPESLAELLGRMSLAVCTVDLGVGPEESIPEAIAATDRGLPPGSRREALLAAATRLFSTRGYWAVTMDEVGAAVGVRSTSVYRHFTTKSELLNAVVARGNEPLQLGLARALSRAATPGQALENAVVAYLEFATVHHDLLGVLVAEVVNLPEPHRSRLRQAQHDYVAEWIRLLAATRPELSRVEIRFCVHAALTMINDVARNTWLRAEPGISGPLMRIAARLLRQDTPE